METQPATFVCQASHSSQPPASQLYEELLDAEFGLEGGGHLWGRGAGDAEGDLDSIVDEPLKGSQCTDHDDPGAQTLPQTWGRGGL